MSNMRENRLPGSYPARNPYGILYQLMTMMRLIEAESIDNQRFHSFQILIFLLAHRLHIRNIGKFAQTIAQDRHLIMENTDRHELNIANLIRAMRLYGMEFELRRSRIKLLYILRKTVRHGMRQGMGG